LVWLYRNNARPLFAFAAIWTEFKDDVGSMETGPGPHCGFRRPRRSGWGSATIDGEIVAPDTHGTSDFSNQQNPEGQVHGNRRAFDLL
jgi:hypothetical protein